MKSNNYTLKILKQIFDEKNFSDNTKRLYERCVNNFEKETQSNLGELITIALVEEKNNLDWTSTTLFGCLVSYKKYLDEKYKKQAGIYLNPILIIFEYFDIIIPDLNDSAIDSYEYLIQNQKYAEVIESKVKLDSKPVAIKLINSEEDILKV